MRLIAYMCPSSLEIDISSSFFLLCWQGDSRKSQDLAWAACSVPRKSDEGATNSEFCWMQGPGIECGPSIGFDAFLLSFSTNRMLLLTVSLCLCPPGQNSGISNSSQSLIWNQKFAGSISKERLCGARPFNHCRAACGAVPAATAVASISAASALPRPSLAVFWDGAPVPGQCSAGCCGPLHWWWRGERDGSGSQQGPPSAAPAQRKKGSPLLVRWLLHLLLVSPWTCAREVGEHVFIDRENKTVHASPTNVKLTASSPAEHVTSTHKISMTDAAGRR